jgi:hypothetical protein
MKIKQKKIKPPSSKRIRDFFRRRKPLAISILSLGVLMAMGVVFFAVLGYGAYLKKIGQTTYYKNTLVNVSKLDFSFVKNYAKGRLSEFDEIQIDIKFKHLLRLRYLREQALQESLISKAVKEEEFPAKLVFNGQSHNVKISLTGLLPSSHLRDPNKWSFQVKVRGDDTVEGMKRFGLLLPSTRGYLTDWIGMELMKERGLMGLRVDFVNVSINGKSLGLYYMEERFDKHLIENNRLREGVIFKLDQGFSPYQESKSMATPGTRAQLLMIKRMWQEVMAGNLPPGRFFDLDKLARIFVICDLMNNKHPLAPQNLRFYFNPVTGLAEPIAREWEKLHESDPTELSLFLEEPKPATRHFRFKRNAILQIIFDNPEFNRHYLREAAVLCQTGFLDQFLKARKDIIEGLLNKVYLTWPFYDLSTAKLYENQQYMRSVLFPEADQVTAYFKQREGDHLRLSVRNQQDLPLEISHLSWRDSIRFSRLPEEPALLESKARALPRMMDFRIPPGVSWSDSLVAEIKLHYNVLGIESKPRTTRIFFDGGTNERTKLPVRAANYASFDFIEEAAEQNVIFIPKGNWTLSTDLIIPANKRLEIAAGARIDLLNHAGIVSYSPVFCLGREEMPVVITSSDSTGTGIAVIKAPQRSNLSYTVFDQLSFPKEEDRQWLGAVNFYESPVTISFCTFSNNQKGEHCLQLIRSDFSVDQSTFRNIRAGAFYADFCTGSISNTSFVHIGKNGIEAAGSNLNIRHVFMNHVGSNGLCAGANSELKVRWLDLRDAATGIAGKDQSSISVTDAQLHRNKVGIALFQEKTEFGPSYMTAGRIDIQHSETPFLIEQNSTLVLEGQPFKANRDKVDEI